MVPGAGLAAGNEQHLDVHVTSDMTATVGDREIHPAYGTVAFVGHVERLCRALLEPHLEPGEEGVGYRLELVHVRPVPVGRDVHLAATVTELTTDAVTCEVVATTGGGVAGRATFVQRIVPADDFAARLAAGEDDDHSAGNV